MRIIWTEGFKRNTWTEVIRGLSWVKCLCPKQGLTDWVLLHSMDICICKISCWRILEMLFLSRFHTRTYTEINRAPLANIQRKIESHLTLSIRKTIKRQDGNLTVIRASASPSTRIQFQPTTSALLRESLLKFENLRATVTLPKSRRRRHERY